MTEIEYFEFLKPYRRALRTLLLELEFFREDVPGIEVHSVSDRLKTFESASKKAVERGMPLTEMQDIAGIRIVAATQSDAEAVARFFTFKPLQKEWVVVNNEKISRSNGYRARHIVIAEKTWISPGPFVEIQIVSLIENAFNHISRTWTYKSSVNLPKQWQKEFKAVARELADIDRRIQELHKEVVTSSAQQADTGPTTPFTYQIIAMEVFGKEVGLEDAVDAVQMLGRVGLRTNGQLRDSFRDPRFKELHSEFKALEAQIQSSEGIGSRDDYTFHSFVAVRYNAALDYLDRLRNIYKAKQIGSSDTTESELKSFMEFMDAFEPMT